MVKISKDYQICYAHRLLNHQGKCARLHGHNGMISISVDGNINEEESSPRHGMVLDFEDLDFGIGHWLDNVLDHRTILEIGDPLIRSIIDSEDEDSIIVIDQPPTAEFLAMFIYTKVKDWLKVFKGEFQASVTFWETPKASATVNDFSKFVAITVDSPGNVYAPII